MNNWILGKHMMCMDEAGAGTGEGAGGGAGAGAGAGDGAGAGEGGTGGAYADAGAGQGEGEGEGGTQGALGAGGAGEGLDWDKMTDAEYFGKVEVPAVEGVKIDTAFAANRYGAFCRKHHIDPKVAAEFMKLEGEGFAKQLKANREAVAKKAAEVRANFDSQGRDLHAKYSPEQIGRAVDALRNSTELNGDADFMNVVTSQLSNNKTMVALLLNWAETHRGDSNVGAGAGTGGDGSQGFASRWIGHKI